MPPIDIFFRDCLVRLKRIAAASRGDASLNDVKNEAWVIAQDLALAGTPLDLSSPAGQDSMLIKLYGKFVKQMRTRIGFALRLDKDWDQAHDDSRPRLADTLRAPEHSDPLKVLEQRESTDDIEVARRRSYSQATAYAICLAQRPSALSLATYLCITLDTLHSRIRRWRAWIEFQPSLFDGVEYVSRDFVPLPGTLPAPEVAIHYDGHQQAWEF